MSEKVIQKSISEGKIVLYTAIIDNYDRVDTLLDKNILIELKKLGIDGILFTNNKIESNGLYQVRNVELKYSDPYRTAREIKLRPDLFLPEYQLSIWIDSNLKIINAQRIKAVLLKCLTGFDIAIKIHSLRTCLYHEEEFVLKFGKDNSNITGPQMLKYKTEGYPTNNGLFETGVIFRRHLSPSVIEFGKLWLRELLYHSHRDQLSCNYVAWKTKIKIYPIPNSLFNSLILKTKGHKLNKRKNPIITSIKGFINNIDITKWLNDRIQGVDKKFLYIEDTIPNILKENNINIPLENNQKFILTLNYEINNIKFYPKIFETDINTPLTVLIDNRNLDLKKKEISMSFTENINIKEEDNFLFATYRSPNVDLRVDEIYLKNWSKLDENDLILALKKCIVKDYFYDIDKGYPKELVIGFTSGKVIICNENCNSFVNIEVCKYNPGEILLNLINPKLKLGIILFSFGDKWQKLKNSLENFINLTRKLKKKYILVADTNSSDNFFTSRIPYYYENIDYEKIDSKNGGFTISVLNYGLKKCLEKNCDIILFTDPFNSINLSLINFINTIYYDNTDTPYIYAPISNNPGPILGNLYQKSNVKNYKEFNKTNHEDCISLSNLNFPNYFFLGFNSNMLKKCKLKDNYFFNPQTQKKDSDLIYNFTFNDHNFIPKIVRNCFIYRDPSINLKTLTQVQNLSLVYSNLNKSPKFSETDNSLKNEKINNTSKIQQKKKDLNVNKKKVKK